MNHRTLALAGGIVVAAMFLGAARARSDARVDRLATRVDSLVVSLARVIDAVGAARPTPLADTLKVEASGPSRGAEDAPVTLVEFVDYECPFCRRFHAETMPALLDEYVETGQLRLVLRDLPLPIHEHAMRAARAARCAADQDEARYWGFSDLLLAVEGPLGPERIDEVARDVGLDAQLLSACVASGRHDAAIQADAADAAAAGLTGTPGFIIGPTDRDGSVRGRAIRGAYPIDVFRDAIESALQVSAGS